MDTKSIAKMFFEKTKEYARNAGHGCEASEDCEFVSVGFTCDLCFKKLCNNHLYFKVSKDPKMAPICPSCMVKQHPELFDVNTSYEDEEEYEEEYEEEEEEAIESDEIIDADYEES